MMNSLYVTKIFNISICYPKDIFSVFGKRVYCPINFKVQMLKVGSLIGKCAFRIDVRDSTLSDSSLKTTTYRYKTLWYNRIFNRNYDFLGYE